MEEIKADIIRILQQMQVMNILSAILSQTEITDHYCITNNYENGVLYHLDGFDHQQNKA